MSSRWPLVFPVVLAAFSLVSLAGLPGLAWGEDANVPQLRPEGNPAVLHDSGTMARKRLYFFSTDFPPSLVGQYPSPPTEETRFWQLLDKEMATTDDLRLTADPAEADYRIELRCTGVLNCSRLLVDIKSPTRDVLASFSLRKINRFGAFGAPNLDLVSKELTTRLDERLKLLPQGGYGHLD